MNEEELDLEEFKDYDKLRTFFASSASFTTCLLFICHAPESNNNTKTHMPTLYIL